MNAFFYHFKRNHNECTFLNSAQCRTKTIVALFTFVCNLPIYIKSCVTFMCMETLTIRWERKREKKRRRGRVMASLQYPPRAALCDCCCLYILRIQFKVMPVILGVPMLYSIFSTTVCAFHWRHSLSIYKIFCCNWWEWKSWTGPQFTLLPPGTFTHKPQFAVVHFFFFFLLIQWIQW